jgi:hypothetical protein
MSRKRLSLNFVQCRFFHALNPVRETDGEDAKVVRRDLKLARNTVPARLRGILQTIIYRVKQAGGVAGEFEFLPDADFCFCASIQASIRLWMPVSAHWSRAFSSLSISGLIFI